MPAFKFLMADHVLFVTINFVRKLGQQAGHFLSDLLLGLDTGAAFMFLFNTQNSSSCKDFNGEIKKEMK